MRKIEKILTYIENHGIAEAQFERRAGISNGYLRNTLSRGADVTQKILDRIKNSNPLDYYGIFPEEKGSVKEVAKAQAEDNPEYLKLYIQSILEQKRILEDQNQFLRRNFEVSLSSIAEAQQIEIAHLKALSWYSASVQSGQNEGKTNKELVKINTRVGEYLLATVKKDS